MKTIEYRASYAGEMLSADGYVSDEPTEEIICVEARNITSGFAKALRVARAPLGNGRVREIARIEFWRTK